MLQHYGCSFSLKKNVHVTRYSHKFMKFFFRVFPNLERIPLELRDNCSVKLVAYFIGPKSCRKYFENLVDFAKTADNLCEIPRRGLLTT